MQGKTGIYYYVRNLQGDITDLVDNAGTTVVHYDYDAWGNVINLTDNSEEKASQENPFTYRGYYRDAETGLYYLQSRYYDSETGRFVNADSTKIIGNMPVIMTTNLFTYCNNSPSNYSDPTGYEVDCFGIFASAKAFVGSSILAFIAIDDFDKVAFMYTSSVVISTNAGFSAGVYLSYHRKKDSYKELLGSSWSISAGISLGANFSVSFSGKLEEICVSGGGGVSLFPIELSVSYGITACIKELQQGKVSKVTYSKRIGIRRKKISITMRTYKKYVCVTNSLTNRKLKYTYKSKQVKSYS